jgi:hypothetical protein
MQEPSVASLSIFDHNKGCFILNPKAFIINAFHPDYVKVHAPELLAAQKLEQRRHENSKNMTRFVEKKRKTKPSHGTVFGVTDGEVSIRPVGNM